MGDKNPKSQEKAKKLVKAQKAAAKEAHDKKQAPTTPVSLPGKR